MVLSDKYYETNEEPRFKGNFYDILDMFDSFNMAYEDIPFRRMPIEIDECFTPFKNMYFDARTGKEREASEIEQKYFYEASIRSIQFFELANNTIKIMLYTDDYITKYE